jgi:hypothetical protein
MVNMFSVVLKPLLTNILRIIRTPYQQYQWLTKCLRKSMALPSSQHSLNVRSASYCCSHRVANVLAKMNILISRWTGPKWRLDCEYFRIGLTPRSSSVGPLLTNILRMLTNACQCLYERCKRLRMIYQCYQCLRKSRRMTVFATFAEINKPVCKLSDLRKEVGNNLWTFRICYQRLRRHDKYCEEHKRSNLCKEVENDLWT